MVKNTTTPLYSETTKPEKIFDKEKTTDDVKIKKNKKQKQSHTYKGYANI